MNRNESEGVIANKTGINTFGKWLFASLIAICIGTAIKQYPPSLANMTVEEARMIVVPGKPHSSRLGMVETERGIQVHCGYGSRKNYCPMDKLDQITKSGKSFTVWHDMKDVYQIQYQGETIMDGRRRFKMDFWLFVSLAIVLSFMLVFFWRQSKFVTLSEELKQ